VIEALGYSFLSRERTVSQHEDSLRIAPQDIPRPEAVVIRTCHRPPQTFPNESQEGRHRSRLCAASIFFEENGSVGAPREGRGCAALLGISHWRLRVLVMGEGHCLPSRHDMLSTTSLDVTLAYHIIILFYAPNISVDDRSTLSSYTPPLRKLASTRQFNPSSHYDVYCATSRTSPPKKKHAQPSLH
jgi:hypothetical protein